MLVKENPSVNSLKLVPASILILQPSDDSISSSLLSQQIPKVVGVGYTKSGHDQFISP